MKIWILLFIILAVIYDYRDFQIPNWLNGIGACITLILAGICGMKVMDITAGVLIVFASCGLLFYIGCLGGGDVKLLMVCGIRLFQYITRCIKNKRLLVYETGEQDSMQGGIIHFSFGILAAYIIYLSGGVV